ncbi:MAG: pre-peptidase C-terminal domain-containing protein, partial [Candidatus Hydrogenedentes bacterium]|nr:pre-peptidase C-terminal domain-containing protein [Candidatus Hydrogenedentota bacterium]
MVRRLFIIYAAAFTVLLAQNAWCVSPNLTNILPRGGARGSEVEVRFVGSKLGDSVDLIFHDTGITLVEIKEAAGDHVTCVLGLAPDCRVGAHAIRVRTLTGASNLRLFSVGTLTELSETEPNNDPAAAQSVELGTTVNGIVTNEDADYFAVELNEGDSIAVEIEALRLGTTLFDPKLRLFGPQGHELLAEDDTALMKQDAAFVHTARESGRYLVAVTEASYGGSASSYYRLHIGAFPRPLAVTPMGGLPGTATQLRWLGDPALETSEVVLPEGEPGLRAITISSEAGIAPTPMPFLLSEWPGVMESEPNDTRENATAGTVPGAFDGVVQEDGDVDWYSFEGSKGQAIRIRVWARALGSPLDSVMTLVGPNGAEVASDDDGAGMDSTVRVTLPEDGTYLLSVRDHLRRGGATFAYRIHVGPVKQELTLSIPDMEAASMVVARGNRSVFVLGTTRSNFDGPLTIEFVDLPAGVTAEYGVIPAGQTRIPVLLTAA